MPRDPRVDPLIEQAKWHCDGCRLAWRLDGWKHRKPMPIECTAKVIRQKLRDIAAELRSNERARTNPSARGQRPEGVSRRA